METPPVNTLLVGTDAMVQVGISPTTVTVALQVFVLPLTSLTVRITVLLPRLAQVNAVLETLNVIGLQLSVLLLSTLAGVMLAVPPTKVMVIGLQLGTGAVTS